MLGCGPAAPLREVRQPKAITVRIGSTNFSEQLVLAELYGQALGAKGFRIERHPSLGSRENVEPALEAGRIDLYAEYLATMLAFVTRGADRGSPDPAATHRRLVEALGPAQRMLDDCATPYYVQVDEDMLLYPHAVRSLHEAITAAPSEVAIVVRNLYDVHLERCVLGVKIFRHAIVRRYPFRAMEAFEVDQVRRFEADGYRLDRSPTGLRPVHGETLGMHGTRWTPATIYERYANLQRRFRGYPERMRWFTEYEISA